MSTDENYGKIHNDILRGMSQQLTFRDVSCHACQKHAHGHVHGNKTIDIEQLNNLMSENEYVVHCQQTIDKKPCYETHGSPYGTQCHTSVIFGQSMLIWTNKSNLIVVTLQQRWDTIEFYLKKTGCSSLRDTILNKFAIDAIKQHSDNIVVYHPEKSWGDNTFFPNAFDQAIGTIRLIINLNDKIDKFILETAKNELLEHETQTASETKLKVEIEQLKLELETTKLELAKSKHKSDKLSIIKTKFDELFDTF